MKKTLPYIALGVLIAIIFLSTCREDRKFPDDDEKIDTIFIDREIPGDTITIIQEEFYPVIEYETDPKIIKDLEDLKTEKERLEYLLSKLTTKVYDTTYAFERGRLQIADTVQGTLMGRFVNIELDPIPYTETQITKTITKYPKFTISAGLEAGIAVDKSFIGANIGFKNRNGYQLRIGYNTLEQVNVGLSKDIFTLY